MPHGSVSAPSQPCRELEATTLSANITAVVLGVRHDWTRRRAATVRLPVAHAAIPTTIQREGQDACQLPRSMALAIEDGIATGGIQTGAETHNPTPTIEPIGSSHDAVSAIRREGGSDSGRVDDQNKANHDPTKQAMAVCSAMMGKMVGRFAAAR